MNIKLNSFKLYIIAVLIIIVCVCLMQSPTFVSAESKNDVESNLSEIVNDISNGIELSEVEAMLNDIEYIDIIDKPLTEKLSDILSGKYFSDYSKVSSALISLVIGDIRKTIPFILTIIAVGILCNLVYNLKSDGQNVSEIINFVFLSVVIIIVLVVFKSIISSMTSTFNMLTKQMQIFFPILLTLLSSIGSFASVSIYNPLVAVLTTTISLIFEKVLYPIFIIIFVFTIIGSLSSNVKLDKLSNFFMSTFKWIIGIVFTLFTGFLGIQGISAGKFDSISIKATKFAVKSYIPIIGSYVSDGMDFIVLGSILVKNAVGVIGVLVLFVTIISPIISILIYKLSLSFCAGILELSGNNKFSSFLSNCSKVLILPIVLLVGVSFMYIITICLIICTANIF